MISEITAALLVIQTLAILLSPVIVWIASLIYFRFKENKDRKMWIFSTLMSHRNDLLNEEHLRALNLIDIIFHDRQNICQTWHEFI